MIQQFSNPDVVDATTFNMTQVLPSGQEGKGSGDGVFRDCVTGFWTEFIDQCCVRNHEKIPIIRHDFQTKHWTAVARIIFKGYQCLMFFPAFLSASVITNAIYGKQVSNLLEHFMKYITDSENKLFTMALQNFDSVLTKMTSWCLRQLQLPVKCHKRYSVPDSRGEPKVIVNCWTDVLKQL
ncbi:hypothetical protein KP79_PYT25358 [Mizuhopecten yessoensis]|uniref:Uncharacterized protein n=1 Tax=Mizuhopecten yessoensis TaxID=6573 RepID=A0A210R1Q5_MIZYE|nr:hypothetical protein KP79_PYT25358 [Mizuhopecten yessoensis]